MKNGDGFVVGYSITSPPTFDAAGKLKVDICRIKESTDIPMMLVGNKCDLESERQVSTEEGKRMAAQWNVGFIESSAKANKNVNQLFYELVRMIDKHREKNPSNSSSSFEAPKERKGGKGFCVLL
eukprot:Phypoly_transcript_11909.p1 GENE.Phypoly_transcript_11909~~Phypoly_transcript_11909.p1  ORF type:complete len:125 (+),score=23.05 Phypoly_transcript_11909:622-996(+)